MSVFNALLFLVAGCVFLYFGAEWLVDGGVAIARRMGVSMLVIGLTLVAFATSAPELVVSLVAAVKGMGDVSVGNVIGSNICNILLILGASSIVYPIAVQRQLLCFDVPVMLVSSVVFAALGLWLGGLNRWTGGVFLVGILLYIGWNVHSARKKGLQNGEEEASPKKLKNVYVASGLVLLGGVALVGGGQLFVRGAVELGRAMGVSEAVIALTVVALGTSLPELATSVIAALKHETDIAIGNVLGSNIFNILCIMGAAPLVSPFKTTGIALGDWLAMIVAAVLLVPFMLTGPKISRKEGAVMLAFYVGYVVYLAVR